MTRSLHILDQSLTMHSGYTFRTRAILKAPIAMGWEVACVTGQRHTASGPDVATVDDLQFHRTQGEAMGPSPLREWRQIGALASKVDESARVWKPDLLHAHSPVLTALAALRVARRQNVPFLYVIRAFWEDAAVGHGPGPDGSLRYPLTHLR